MLDPKKLKQDFPILKRDIVYLDNAATTQKPRQVIEAITRYYETNNANIHRGIHTLSEEATLAYEDSRKATAQFINAASEKEIVFTRNATESINLVANTWGETNIRENDEIVVSALEHHSNLVPWQQLAKRKNARLVTIPLKPNLTLANHEFTPKTKLLALTAMSNVLGTIPPIKKLIEQAHATGAKVLIDAAQSAAHLPTDVQDMQADFLAFSAHKMLGPKGVGVLYARQEFLEEMPPFLYGGDMVKTVTSQDATWNDVPHKFEAGTPNIADVAAFKEALTYLQQVGLENIHAHELALLSQAKLAFEKYPQVTLYSQDDNSHATTGGILSFTIKGIHPHDIAEVFNHHKVAIRAGHHCNQPLMQHLQIPATARLSFYLYNTREDIAAAEKALQETIKTFA